MAPASVESSDTIVPFTARDGLALNLVHVESPSPPTRGPIMLVHGAGVRANIFRAPVETNVVDVLVAEGYDVWLENWRASIDVAPNRWTLDQAAAYDHPAAVEKVLAETGAETMQAIIHCQGSTSFAMSAVAGLVPEVTTIVTNAVSLHPVVPDLSKVKLRYVSPLVARLTDYTSPQWGDHATGWLQKTLNGVVRLTHHECDNNVCKWVSFTYGTGFPALWSHENLNEETHEWVRREFAEVPMTFFDQMAKCVQRGHLVSVDDTTGLPRDFTARPPQTDARFVFLAGEDNLCFLPESQRLSFEFANTHRPGKHVLHTIPKYGHLDIFMGARAAHDVFPIILEELER